MTTREKGAHDDQIPPHNPIRREAIARDLVRELRERVGEDHERGCDGRNYGCSCGFDAGTDDLLNQAADRIEALEAENDRLNTGGFTAKDGGQWVRKDRRDEAEARACAAEERVRALEASPLQGEWVLVPKEPTEEMRDAGYMASTIDFDILDPDAARQVWFAMIAAAPSLPCGGVGDQGDRGSSVARAEVAASSGVKSENHNHSEGEA